MSELQQLLADFAREGDWDLLHSMKNLATSPTLAAAEMQAALQSHTFHEAAHVMPDT